MKVLLIVHQFFLSHRMDREVPTLEVARGLTPMGHHRLHCGDADTPNPIAFDSSAPPWVEFVERGVARMRPQVVR